MSIITQVGYDGFGNTLQSKYTTRGLNNADNTPIISTIEYNVCSHEL